MKLNKLPVPSCMYIFSCNDNCVRLFVNYRSAMGWRLESDGVNEILRVDRFISKRASWLISLASSLSWSDWSQGQTLSRPSTVIFWNQDSLIGYNRLSSLNSFLDSTQKDIRLFRMNIMGSSDAPWFKFNDPSSVWSLGAKCWVLNRIIKWGYILDERLYTNKHG